MLNHDCFFFISILNKEPKLESLYLDEMLGTGSSNVRLLDCLPNNDL